MSEQDTRLLAEKLLDAAYARIDGLKGELAKARNAALEEAAKIANCKWQQYQGHFGSQPASSCAHEIETAIRALLREEE